MSLKFLLMFILIKFIENLQIFVISSLKSVILLQMQSQNAYI